MRIIPRSEWGARPARNRTTVDRSRRRAFVLHYDDAKPTSKTGPEVPRQIQRFHMDSNGWADIGYNFVIDQAGRIYEGRGWDVIGAHAGTGGNTEGIGVQIHIGGAQRPTAEALAAAEWLWRQANARFGRTLALKGHQSYMATSCPGAPLMEIVRNGFPKKAVSPPPQSANPPVIPAPLGDSVPDIHAPDRFTVHHHGKGWQLIDLPIFPPRNRPTRYVGSAHVKGPGQLRTRFVAWFRGGNDWLRYPEVWHPGPAAHTFAHYTHVGDVRVCLDVYSDTPGPVEILLSSLVWDA